MISCPLTEAHITLDGRGWRLTSQDEFDYVVRHLTGLKGVQWPRGVWISPVLPRVKPRQKIQDATLELFP